MDRRSPKPGSVPGPCWGESNALNFLLFESWSQVAQEARQSFSLHLLPRCSVCRLLAPGLHFFFFCPTSLSAQAARMGLFSSGHQCYWSFSSLLLLQPYFCWASLN